MTGHPAETTVLITGASSGIGAGLAREFVRRGMRVALVARRREQLESLAQELRAAGGQASAHQADVTVDGDLARVVAELAAQNIVPGIVIANAGFGVVGRAQKLSLADYQRQLETNMYGVLRTFYETLDCLRQTRGRFVIMGSVAGHISTPGGSPYAMSKFAVRAFAEALHGDLAAAGRGLHAHLAGLHRFGYPSRRQSRRACIRTPRIRFPPWLRMKTRQGGARHGATASCAASAKSSSLSTRA